MKSEGLSASPPVIDCSGWTALLLSRALQAHNVAAARAVFTDDDIAALHTWSERIIHEIGQRTGFVLQGTALTADALPRCATIGLKIGNPAWAANHPRPRGITHIVQIVRRPDDDAPFVSESFDGAVAGIRLTPLMRWLARAQPALDANEAWAVDAFRLASGAARGHQHGNAP
ncbi:hypothetical protein B0G69_3011 [Paraburkholderia sp. RAU2J]|nr:hypothetical protein B0G69_3011 [Paraburkholderia sp. RAU2J]